MSEHVRNPELKLILENICRGDLKSLDKTIFEFFDLTASKSVSQNDLTQMILNLPLEAIIVNFGEAK